jgi:mannose-6-phosphate isomerase
VSNGFLAGNNIEEIIEVYMGDITGEAIYEKYGTEFPLLIKLIEAKEDLSIQVHPGNELAKKRHNAYGKTEMWHILRCEKNAKIYTGFSMPVTRDIFMDSLENNTIQDILNVEEPEPGDTFFIPSGTVHAIGAGTLLAEIQQTSDITYRIYDWGRKNENGKSRELHTDLALDAIDFKSPAGHKIRKDIHENKPVNLVSCEFFDTNIIHFNTQIDRDYNLIDSFVIYICTEGKFSIQWDERSETVSKGETVLLPAQIRNVILEPDPEASLLEIYINTEMYQS